MAGMTGVPAAVGAGEDLRAQFGAIDLNCTGKVAFQSAAAAHRHCGKRLKFAKAHTYLNRVTVYRCKSCNLYHLGLPK